ncbi:hypothetical protein RyT2_29120 [Pseudolactococcus yaeyamensis]
MKKIESILQNKSIIILIYLPFIVAVMVLSVVMFIFVTAFVLGVLLSFVGFFYGGIKAVPSPLCNVIGIFSLISVTSFTLVLLRKEILFRIENRKMGK